MGLVFSRIQKCNGVENSLIRLKKSTGSAFAISSMMLESGFKVEEGELDATTLPKGSGSGYKPFFCKNVAPIFIVNMREHPELF